MGGFTMSQSESFTTEEIASLLKVSKLTVYDLIKKGEIQAYRVGRQMRIDAYELERYKIRGQEVKRNHIVSCDEKVNLKPIVISGQDNSLDILARQLEMTSNGFNPLRSHVGSLDSLIAMYQGRADIVSLHLFDGDTGAYNIAYARKLLVSKSFVVVKFITRRAGLYVEKGNPKGITSWEDIVTKDVTIVNREPGAGARVLLDEQLRLAKLNRQDVKGYDIEQSSHLAVASAIAGGIADVGVGIEQTAKVANIDFLPMITESYDLVMLKDDDNRAMIADVLNVLQDNAFQNKLLSLGYEFEGIGTILWEQ